MPGSAFFARLGLYVKPRFLSAEACMRLQEAMVKAPRDEALLTRGHDVVYDEEERSTSRARLDAAMRDAMRARFRDEMPAVAAHFKTPLHTLQRLQYLIYEPGDFFKLHMDGSSHPEADESLRRRKISMILFVNGQATEPCEGCFCGGSLIFYDLLKGPAWKGKGFPIDAEPGLLMAFPADLLHEVAPVTAGIRFTVVGWAE